MKLLICTQAVDEKNLHLGFFHGWLEEMAKHFELITVICLEEGVHTLPKNVEVLSLGKEKGTSRATRALRVLRFSTQKRNKYDAVFVHMNEEYVLLAGWLWKLFGKRIYMWRNHYAGGWRTDVAARWCDKIFCTSQFSYTMKYPKTMLMPVGVDTVLYTRMPEVSRDPCSILFYARMAPSKNPDILLEALGLLHTKGVFFAADFYGTPLPRDERYLESLKSKAKQSGLGDVVRFLPGAPHTEGPRIFNAHSIYVDLGASGMYNKTLFEAAACECLVLTVSRDFAEIVSARFIVKENDIQDLADKIESLLKLSVIERQALGSQLRAVAKDNNLETLGKRLAQEIHP